MNSAGYKEIQDLLLEQKKVAQELRADYGANWSEHKKNFSALEQEVKKLTDAVADVQKKNAMQTNGVPTELESKAFLDFARKGVNINNETVGPQGGFLVPQVLYNKIVEKAKEDCVIRQLADVITINSSSIDIPMEENGDTVDMIGELESYPSAEVKFQNVHIPVFDFARSVPVTNQLVDDSAFNIESYIVSHIARKKAEAEDNAFLNGKSPKNPEGILKAEGLGNVTTAAANAITFDELIDMTVEGDISKSTVLQDASYIVHPATFQYLRKLKDNNQRYFQLPLGEKMPYTLNGIPVYTDTMMDRMGAGKKTAICGDIKAYKIIDRLGMEILRNPYKVDGQVLFQFRARVGGAVVDKSKLATLTMHA